MRNKEKIVIIILSLIIGLMFGFMIGFLSGMATLESMITFVDQIPRQIKPIPF